MYSCKEKSEESKIDKAEIAIKEVKNDSIATIIGKVSPNDFNCISEIEIAKSEIKKNKLTYYVWKDRITAGRYVDELQKLLNPYNIKCAKISGLGNCIPLVNSRANCYFDYMNAAIKNKFKKGLMDSLENQAIKTYAKNNLNDVLVYLDDTLKVKFYPNSKTYKTQRENIERDFIKNFTYPENFNKDDLWQASISFIIHRDSSIKISYIHVSFNNENNKPFTSYFEKAIEDFIIKTDWIAYRLDDIKLDSEIFLEFTGNP